MATPADKEKYSHYVAIDFGTAGSTLAFSTSTSQDVHLLSDYSKRRAGEEIKVPTIILLDPDKRYEAFGSKALHCYQNGTVMQRDRFDQYYLFTRFKMTLYSEFPEKNLIANLNVQTVDKKELPAVTVIGEVLKYFKFEFFDCYKNFQQKDDIVPPIEKIKWILTVPAIWSLAAKQIMRNAAIKAGLVSQNENSLIFALEPEAAAIYCQKRFSLIPDQEPERSKCYLIADCGGGTVDIATYQLTCYENGHTKIEELTQVHGGDLGGFAVNDQFEEMFIKMSKLSDDEITEMKQTFPAKWTKLMNDFETCKASNEKVERTVSVPKEICRHIEQKHKEFKSMENLVNAYCTHKIKWDSDENDLILFYPTLRTFFVFVITRICEKIKKALDNTPKKYSIQAIVLVGGFGACDVLHEIVTETFSPINVITGPHPHLAVVNGAVIFGKEENLICSRIMPYTVGVKVSEDEEKHKCFKTVKNGQKYCDTVFHTLIKAKESVKAGKVYYYDFSPASDSQSHCDITFYATTKENIMHVDDDGCHRLGSCRIEGLPKEQTGISREIHLSVDFSSTDGIKILAHSENDNKEFPLSYDFIKNDHNPIYLSTTSLH